MAKCFHCHRTAVPGHSLCHAHMKSALSQGTRQAEPVALSDEQIEDVYRHAQWDWGGKGDVDAFFLKFARKIERWVLAASAPALQAGQGEPVAYRYKDSRGHWRYCTKRPHEAYEILLKPEPLYLASPTHERAAPAPSQPVAAEGVAKAIYEQWADKPGFVPWVERGNSLMQDKARDIARAALSGSAESKKGEDRG